MLYILFRKSEKFNVAECIETKKTLLPYRLNFQIPFIVPVAFWRKLQTLDQSKRRRDAGMGIEIQVSNGHEY